VRSAIAAARDPDTTMILVEHRVTEALPLVDRVVVLEPGGGIRADGPPATVFGSHGARLAAEGVWVPGFEFPRLSGRTAAGPVLISASDAAVRDRLRPTTVSAREGEVLAVTGPNGAGKSTLALVLGGLIAPTGGTVRGFGDPKPPHKWKAATLTRRIGSVFQNPEHQFVTSRVRDELAVGLRHPESIVDELLSRLRLTHLAEANPYTLSGGEARRLSVATALAAAPRLLILDEPTFGQDRTTWFSLAQLLAELRDEGHGAIAITHDDAFVTTVADRVEKL
jgi:energy-coupling factor transport system ATP-binding protein